MIFDVDSHDILPISLIMQEFGLNLFNRYGEKWSIYDHDLIGVIPSVAIEVKRILNKNNN